MYVSKVSPKGQVVIPKYFRDRLAIKSYSKVVFSEDEGRLVITVLPADPIAGARGILKKSMPLHELIKKNREEEIACEKKHYRKQSRKRAKRAVYTGYICSFMLFA